MTSASKRAGHVRRLTLDPAPIWSTWMGPISSEEFSPS